MVLDLDHCRDPESGALTEWAADLISRAPRSYTEISVSGTGLHVFGAVAPDLPSGTFVLKRGENGQKIETYVRAVPMIVITGNVLFEPHPLADLSTIVRDLVAEHTAQNGAPPGNGGGAAFDLAGVPTEIARLIVDGGPPDADRSAQLYYVIATLREHGWARAAIVAALRAHPQGIAVKCFEGGRDNVARHVDLALHDVDDRRAAKAAPTTRPVIKLVRGAYTEVATEIERAIVAAGLPVYTGAEGLVYPVFENARGARGIKTRTASLRPISLPLMRQFADQAAVFEKASKQVWRKTEPPEDICRLILSRHGYWPFSRLRGVISAPSLRPDGSLLTAPGYDEQTELFLLDPPQLPAMPEIPTRADATAALAYFVDLLAEFPFVDDASRAVALSAFLSPIARAAYDTVPLHAFSAPAAGSGKSLLTDCCAALISGYACPATAVSRSEEENEKRWGGSLLAGHPLLSLDNVTHPLSSAFLCQLIERTLIEVRRLGVSDKARIAPAMVLYATGNNLTLVGDLVRRSIVARLDASVEMPWTRTFEADPLARILADRGLYLGAALTVLRAYILAGRPVRPSSFGSFDGWSSLVRGALIWCEQADPVETVAGSYQDDPERQSALEVMSHWWALLGITAGGFSVQEVMDRANTAPAPQELRAALLAVAGDRSGHTISPKLFGKWLQHHKDIILGGFKLERQNPSMKRGRWQVLKLWPKWGSRGTWGSIPAGWGKNIQK